jgi:hypothetical protein
MPDTTNWPSYAIQHDPLTALRIPVVLTPWPHCRYMAPDERETR